MQVRKFFIEQVILILYVVRRFLVSRLSWGSFAIIVMLLLLVSIKVDGFRPSSLSIIFIFGLQIFGEAYSNAGIVLLAMILSIGMYFFGAKVYKFPPPTTLLSLSINEENDNRMVSFFRIKNS